MTYSQENTMYSQENTYLQGKDFGAGFMSSVFNSFSNFNSFSADSIKKGASAFFEGIAEGISKIFEEISKNTSKMNYDIACSITRSYLPLLAAGGIIGVGLPLVYIYVHKCFVAKIGKPKMAIEQRRTTLFTQIKGFFFKPSSGVTRKVFFNQETAERIDQIAASTKQIKENRAYFQNVLLAGPPGTGKTMIARQIAEKSDMDFIMMSAGNLSQYIGRKEHISGLNALLDNAESGSKPTLIFIDEAEGIAKDRSMLDHEHVELLNTLIARTGTPSKKIMLVLATNRPDELDIAIRDRMSHEIKIEKPEYAQRVKIISQYADELFANSPNYRKIFSSEAIQIMAKKTEGLSGRSLFNLVNFLLSQEGASKNRQLSQETVDKAISQFVAKARAIHSKQESLKSLKST
jgi:ATP-dependent Zn protease